MSVKRNLVLTALCLHQEPLLELDLYQQIFLGRPLIYHTLLRVCNVHELMQYLIAEKTREDVQTIPRRRSR